MKSPPLVFAWGSWLLVAASAIILLAGLSALQKDCGSSAVNNITIAGAGGYLGPIACDVFFRYSWWIFGMQTLVAIAVPVLLAARLVHTWRLGAIGLLALTTYLLMHTANSYYIMHANASGSGDNRADAVLAGAIIGAVADLALMLLFGARDERAALREEEA